MKNTRILKTSVLLIHVAISGLLLAGCDKAPEGATASAPAPVAQGATATAATANKEAIPLTHVHGLSYSPDGGKILIPSHHGLAVFDGSGWFKAPGPQHDYMGFSATKDAIYSSGHPAPDSGLVNPFGVIKSTDGGQTWQKLGMEGESDFHLLATGYETNAIYVVNFGKNSKMKEPGIYSTSNASFSWQRAAAQGLNSAPTSLAAHPSDPKTIAVGTDKGLYLSRDTGATFERVASSEIVGVFFDLNGKNLWFSVVKGQQPGLTRLDLNSKEATKIGLPAMQKDAAAYIAQNPVKRNEYAIATFQRSVYLSQDQGKTWRQIAENGKTL